jgi:hypothetical protein
MEAFREINVKDESLDSHDLMFIISIAKKLSTIYRISLENTRISDEDLEIFMNNIKNMDNIVILNLRKKSLRVTQIHKLVEMLKGRRVRIDVNLE